MRFRNLSKWDNPSELESLAFFAQLFEELVFDYTLDTYKPSAMNTSLLCYEGLQTIVDIEKGIIQKPNLFHITDELAENLKHDEIVQTLVTLDIKKAIATIQNRTAPLPDIKIILELLMSELRSMAYKQKNEDLLMEAILNKIEKSRITALARSYVTTLLNYGYHAKYLYKTTLSFFYHGSKRITANDCIKDFFLLFNHTPKQFVSIYRASPIFEEIVDSCEAFHIKVARDTGEYSEILQRLGYLLEDNEVYVIVDDLESLEYDSARRNSDNRMELIGTLLTLFHHKEHPQWAEECIVVEVDSREAKRTTKSINPMYKCLDLKPSKASKRLNLLINNFSLNHTSLPKFFRSAELHSQALNSDSLENQIGMTPKY